MEGDSIMIAKNISFFILTPALVLLYFPVYGFLGWIGEVIYRSFTRKRLINPGLLNGPFLPLYGSAAVIIIFLSGILPFNNIIFDFVFFAVFSSTIEYLAAMLAENYFKVRLWEYDDYKFNIKGRICLRFTIYWGLYCVVFLYLIHPTIYIINNKILSNLDTHLLRELYGITILIFNLSIFVDFLISVRAMKIFVQNLNYFFENYLSLENEQIQNYLYKMRKPLRTFKALRKHADKEMKNLLENSISGQLKTIKSNLNSKILSHKPDKAEFEEIAHEILSNEDYDKLSNFLHHNSSTLKHCKKVAYCSYKISKYMGLDYRSATRGALLHDFYLYDWRGSEGRPYKGGLHGFRHPKVALINAEKHFNLNKIEKDIIIKHMWPLTVIPPIYKESILVMFIDKYISSIETIQSVKPNKKKEE